MWARNIVFLLLCLLGLAAVAANLLSSRKIEDPEAFPEFARRSPEFTRVVQQLNDEFEQHWRAQGLQHAGQADTSTIIRRLSLGLTGTIPSLEELRRLDEVPAEQQIDWWVARLLEDRRYADFLAERLGRAFVGTEDGQFLLLRRRRYIIWLSDQIADNVPYDQLVRTMISDRGIMTSDPAVNFLTATVDDGEEGQPNPISLAGRTTRAFLGMRIDCLQCHDDQMGMIQFGSLAEPREGKQSDFHQLAAFYGQANLSLAGIQDNTEQQYRYQYLDSDEEVEVLPMVPFMPELRPTEGSLREQLAVWVTHKKNKPFARAIVNRIWAVMTSRPLLAPVDDIPLFTDPEAVELSRVKFPPGLETLAEDFVAHGFDLHRLIRVIAATHAFRTDSRADFEVLPQHEANWAVFPLSRLRPEQVAGAVIQGSSLRTIDAKSHILSQLTRYQEEGEFVDRYGDLGENEWDDRSGTVTQRLLMMNGKLIRERTKAEIFNASAKIASGAATDEKAVETVYLTALTRKPSSTELDCFVKRLAGKTGDERARVMEDIFWILFNSTEFSWNH